MNNLRVLFLLIPSLLLLGCDAENPSSNLSGTLVNHSECLLKNSLSPQVPSSQSCVSYTYANETLLLTHFNAGFNCCPGTLSATFNLVNDTLYILENESESLCDCNCLYDMDMEINFLEPGDYVIKFVEPYVGIAAEELVFSTNLYDSTSGSFCISRNHYPWNL